MISHYALSLTTNIDTNENNNIKILFIFLPGPIHIITPADGSSDEKWY